MTYLDENNQNPMTYNAHCYDCKEEKLCYEDNEGHYRCTSCEGVHVRKPPEGNTNE